MQASEYSRGPSKIKALTLGGSGLNSTPMTLPLLAILVLSALTLGYFVYGRFVASQFRLDDAAPTPAETVNDGHSTRTPPRLHLAG